MGEIDGNGLHPVVRMHDNLTVMATIARKCETLCEFISKDIFMKTSGGKILLMECKNALKHRSTAHMIANRSALSQRA